MHSPDNIQLKSGKQAHRLKLFGQKSPEKNQETRTN